ncbi:MAG: hypothetical protein JJU29_08965 [Verrucomicrobia bacterium]|nr:hypothetical protein [Verrucomicrobiota bacterium]MCH8511401.1 hypothetical protein [Kiritimatiellia bacterium]
MNTLQDFLEHAQQHDAPDPAWSAPLQALWYAEKGDWARAHDLCQQGDLPDGAWVHANLHREEGDPSNARYWYHRAGKPESDLGIVEERHDIITRLLAG